MYQLINEFLQPYCLFSVLAAVACVNLWRKRVESRRRLLLLSLPLALLVAISLPPVAYLSNLSCPSGKGA
jgi:hypothetical protein